MLTYHAIYKLFIKSINSISETYSDELKAAERFKSLTYKSRKKL